MSQPMNRLFKTLETLIVEGNAVIMQKLDHILTHQHAMLKELKMEKDEIARLVASVAENTNATQAASDALVAFADSNAKLTQALQDAIANNSDVSPDIKAAADAIDANNAVLRAHIPQVAAAVTANTPAA